MAQDGAELRRAILNGRAGHFAMGGKGEDDLQRYRINKEERMPHSATVGAGVIELSLIDKGEETWPVAAGGGGFPGMGRRTSNGHAKSLSL